MTVHKLTAGDGYTYLTRQVASGDRRRERGQSLADYYTAAGNPPGMWWGKAAQQLDVSGQEVSEAQMRALFGAGLHPNAAAMTAAGAAASATRLGQRYPTYDNLPPYAERLEARVAEFAEVNGRAPSEAERNRLASVEARRGRRAVAGFDLVFTPVKSASLLWALGGPEVRQAVEDAHHEAVRCALGWLEQHAAYTRTGHGGLAQVDATGLICAMFDHRESRSGDPDLHTHVAVANKVCGRDGKWRSLDARGLYALGVAASERYNTRLEDAMARRLGARFAARPTSVPGKRPVREVDGVPAELIRHFSRRRAAIEERYDELRRDYRRTHGREPDRATGIRLAQEATLETREGKGPGRTLAAQVADWCAQAESVLGRRRLERMLRLSTGHSPTVVDADEDQQQRWAREVVGTVSAERSTWTLWNVHAETERLLRPLRFSSPEQREHITEAVVAQAAGPRLSIRLAEPELVAEPDALVRESDGESVFVAHGAQRYTTSDVLLAEEALVNAAGGADGPHVDPVVLEAALTVHEARENLVLDPGQRALAAAFATAPARLAVGIGPAGAGKTTAMRAFAAAWQSASMGRIVPLATSSRAAQVLADELGIRSENLHKFLHENKDTGGSSPGDPWFRLRAGDVVLVDEAGMAGTLQLARLLEIVTSAGASLRLLGDPAQLAAVDAGGALQLLDREAGSVRLSDLHRFSDPDEARATLLLRDGKSAAFGFYRDHERITSGSRDAMMEAAYDAWRTDVARGRTSVLVAASNEDVTALNARARSERVAAGSVEPDGVELRDGTTAGVGDWVITRANARTLRYRRDRHVHNGDTWRVVRRHRNGDLTVEVIHRHGKLRLPAAYVGDSVELAYACTAHRTQGTTTDTAHALVTSEMTREALYVASTRGRHGTHWYVAVEDITACDEPHEVPPPRTTDEVLAGVLARTGAERSATLTVRETLAEAHNLHTLVARYDHARDLAARDALELAASGLPADLRGRVLADKAAPYLARVLADVAARGADTTAVLRAANDLGDTGVHPSPAMVLASRVVDMPRSLGATASRGSSAASQPLPWLPAPDVGHPGWLPYLRQRARLIEQRAAELGSLRACYREEYGLEPLLDPSDPDDLGDPPMPDTRRARAYEAALAEQASQEIAPRPDEPSVSPAPIRNVHPAQARLRLSR